VREGGGYCPAHKRAVRQEVESRRESSTARGYGYRWQQTSKGFLRAHPLCQCPECKEGALRLLKSDVTDHIIPHKLDDALKSGNAELIANAWRLFWDRNNWQAMAKVCHDKKTAREDGGFGRPISQQSKG
jgi:5-methylcytosine-specific restriction protein A